MQYRTHDIPDAVLAALTSFETLPIPGTILQLDGTIAAVNAAGCGLLGRPADQLVGHKAWTFAPGLEYAWAELLRIARERGVYRGELAIATPTAARTIRYALAVHEAAGHAYAIGFGVDVTAIETGL